MPEINELNRQKKNRLLSFWKNRWLWLWVGTLIAVIAGTWFLPNILYWLWGIWGEGEYIKTKPCPVNILKHSSSIIEYVAAIFSFLAFLGLLFTIHFQRQEATKACRRHEEALFQDRFFQIFNVFLKRSSSHTDFHQKEEFESDAIKSSSQHKESLSNAKIYHMIAVEASLFFNMIIMIEQFHASSVKESLLKVLSGALSVNQRRNYYVFLFISDNFALMRDNISELVNQNLLIQHNIDGDTPTWGGKLGASLRKSNNTGSI